MIDVAEVNQWRWLEECRQRLENVLQTHLVLASGNPVLQKRLALSISERFLVRTLPLLIYFNERLDIALINLGSCSQGVT